MTRFYSPSTKGFYNDERHASIPPDAVEVTNEERLSLLAQQSLGRIISIDVNGRPIAVDRVLSGEQRVAALTSAVQAHLDQVARSRNYDGILSLCSYVASNVEQFAEEAQAGVAWRDAVWSHCYQVLAEVQAETRAEPTAEQLIAELPAIAW